MLKVYNFRFFYFQLGPGQKGPVPGSVGGEKGPQTGSINTGAAAQPRQVNKFFYYIKFSE